MQETSGGHFTTRKILNLIILDSDANVFFHLKTKSVSQKKPPRNRAQAHWDLCFEDTFRLNHEPVLIFHESQLNIIHGFWGLSTFEVAIQEAPRILMHRRSPRILAPAATTTFGRTNAILPQTTTRYKEVCCVWNTLLCATNEAQYRGHCTPTIRHNLTDEFPSREEWFTNASHVETHARQGHFIFLDSTVCCSCFSCPYSRRNYRSWRIRIRQLQVRRYCPLNAT